jgi:hypothetical protein
MFQAQLQILMTWSGYVYNIFSTISLYRLCGLDEMLQGVEGASRVQLIRSRDGSH